MKKYLVVSLVFLVLIVLYFFSPIKPFIKILPAPVQNAVPYHLIAKGPVIFTAGGKGLQLTYEVENVADLKNPEQLKKAAQTMQATIQEEAEKGAYTSIIITAIEKNNGAPFQKQQGYNVIFTRETGQWVMIPLKGF